MRILQFISSYGWSRKNRTTVSLVKASLQLLASLFNSVSTE